MKLQSSIEQLKNEELNLMNITSLLLDSSNDLSVETTPLLSSLQNKLKEQEMYRDKLLVGMNLSTHLPPGYFGVGDLGYCLYLYTKIFLKNAYSYYAHFRIFSRCYLARLFG